MRSANELKITKKFKKEEWVQILQNKIENDKEITKKNPNTFEE